jgi:guanylate kinase
MSAPPLPPPAPVLLLLSAPSGGGKTTVSRELLARVPGLTRVITCTTRPPRPGEQDGVDYHFLTSEAFERQVAAGEFLEHAVVYSHRYGTRRAEALALLDRGRDVLLNVDVQGADNLRALAERDPRLRAALVTVFLTPPSIEILAERLRRRAQDPPAVIERRLAEARREIATWPRFDYLVLSETVEADVRRVQAILEVEKLRTTRRRAGAGAAA